MKFHAQVDATFEADHIDEAFTRLAIHIMQPLVGLDEDLPQWGWLGTVSVRPVDD